MHNFLDSKNLYNERILLTLSKRTLPVAMLEAAGWQQVMTPRWWNDRRPMGDSDDDNLVGYRVATAARGQGGDLRVWLRRLRRMSVIAVFRSNEGFDGFVQGGWLENDSRTSSKDGLTALPTWAVTNTQGEGSIDGERWQ